MSRLHDAPRGRYDVHSASLAGLVGCARLLDALDAWVGHPPTVPPQSSHAPEPGDEPLLALLGLLALREKLRALADDPAPEVSTHPESAESDGSTVANETTSLPETMSLRGLLR